MRVLADAIVRCGACDTPSSATQDAIACHQYLEIITWDSGGVDVSVGTLLHMYNVGTPQYFSTCHHPQSAPAQRTRITHRGNAPRRPIGPGHFSVTSLSPRFTSPPTAPGSHRAAGTRTGRAGGDAAHNMRHTSWSLGPPQRWILQALCPYGPWITTWKVGRRS